jgi:hypothetical protein
METNVFWGVAPCSLVEIYRCFKGAVSIIRAMMMVVAVSTPKRRSVSDGLCGATSQKTVIFLKWSCLMIENVKLNYFLTR